MLFDVSHRPKAVAGPPLLVRVGEQKHALDLLTAGEQDGAVLGAWYLSLVDLGPEVAVEKFRLLGLLSKQREFVSMRHRVFHFWAHRAPALLPLHFRPGARIVCAFAPHVEVSDPGRLAVRGAPLVTFSPHESTLLVSPMSILRLLGVRGDKVLVTKKQ